MNRRPRRAAHRAASRRISCPEILSGNARHRTARRAVVTITRQKERPATILAWLEGTSFRTISTRSERTPLAAVFTGLKPRPSGDHRVLERRPSPQSSRGLNDAPRRDRADEILRGPRSASSLRKSSRWLSRFSPYGRLSPDGRLSPNFRSPNVFSPRGRRPRRPFVT